jgi:hypothetical protein
MADYCWDWVVSLYGVMVSRRPMPTKGVLAWLAQWKSDIASSDQGHHIEGC